MFLKKLMMITNLDDKLISSSKNPLTGDDKHCLILLQFTYNELGEYIFYYQGFMKCLNTIFVVKYVSGEDCSEEEVVSHPDEHHTETDCVVLMMWLIQ